MADEGDEGQDGERDSISGGGGRNRAGSWPEDAAAAAADPTMTSGWSGLLLWLWTGLEDRDRGEEASLPEVETGGGSVLPRLWECEAKVVELVLKEGGSAGIEGR